MSVFEMERELWRRARLAGGQLRETRLQVRRVELDCIRPRILSTISGGSIIGGVGSLNPRFNTPVSF
jgi:hypothetical protein